MNAKIVIFAVLSSLIACSSACNVKSSTYTTSGKLNDANWISIDLWNLPCNFQMSSSLPTRSDTSPSFPLAARTKSTQFRSSLKWTDKFRPSSVSRMRNISSASLRARNAHKLARSNFTTRSSSPSTVKPNVLARLHQSSHSVASKSNSREDSEAISSSAPSLSSFQWVFSLPTLLSKTEWNWPTNQLF